MNRAETPRHTRSNGSMESESSRSPKVENPQDRGGQGAQEREELGKGYMNPRKAVHVGVPVLIPNTSWFLLFVWLFFFTRDNHQARTS